MAYSHEQLSRLSFAAFPCLGSWSALSFLAAFAFVAGLETEAKAQGAFDLGASSATNAAALQVQEHQVAEIVKQKMPNAAPDVVERTSREFLQRLKETSPIASEKFAKGSMSDTELTSRIDVYLAGISAAAAHRAPQAGEPRDWVADLLKREPGIAKTDAERKALADRFIERLGALSATARANLLSGKMPPEELQSRVTVFVADLRAQASQVTVDPAVAAAAPIVEAYIKANFGSAADRPDAISFRGTVEQGDQKPEFVIFKKRPNKLRIHAMKNGLVIGVVAYDGSAAWRQIPAKQPVAVTGAAAASLAESARFDDPLIGFKERGAEVRLEDKPGSGPLKLRITEADGSVSVSTIDPATYRQISLRRLDKDAHWSESRFSDYRKVGPVTFPYVIEELKDGTLKSTTRITSISLNPGLLDQLFAAPTNPSLDFMDYMRALAILDERSKQSVANQVPTSLRK